MTYDLWLTSGRITEKGGHVVDVGVVGLDRQAKKLRYFRMPITIAVPADFRAPKIQYKIADLDTFEEWTGRAFHRIGDTSNNTSPIHSLPVRSDAIRSP